MLDLIEVGNAISPIPVIQIRDLQIDIEPSEFFLLPSIHIDARIEVRFPW